MGRQLHLRDDHMNGNWSLGSNYHPCSQSRKISIGVMADSSAKTNGNNGKVVITEFQTSENVTSTKSIPAEIKQVGKEVISPDLGRQNNAPRSKSSVLVHPNTSYQNTSHSDVIGHPEKVSSVPSTCNANQQPSGAMRPDSSLANKMVNPNARDANEKNLRKNTYQREGGDHGLMGREEESLYATAQKVLTPEKGIAEKGSSERGNSGNTTLRMKVQELLGTAFSPDRKHCNPETFGVDANKLKPMPKTISESLVAMHKQHLHRRETNIASLNDKTRRPVTRSLTHNKPQAQKSEHKKQAPFCQYKRAHLDNNEFSFVETRSWKPSTDVTLGSTMCKRKEKDILGTRPVKKCLVEEVHKEESQQVTDGRKPKSADANISLFAHRTGDNEIVKPNAEIKPKTCHQTEFMTKRHHHGDNETMLYKNMDQNPFAKQSLANDVDPLPQYDLKSPTFELKTTAPISSSRSLFETDHEDLDGDSQCERGFKEKETCSSHDIGFLKEGQYSANAKSSGMGSPIVKPASSIEGRKVYKCSESPSKEVQSESSEDGSPVTVPNMSENCHGNRWFVSPCQQEDSGSSEDVSLIEGDRDCGKIHDSLEQDELMSAVKLFTLALERVESKIHSTTSRQSSEILLSVSDNICLQLQSAESKIQTEVGKLTNLGKSKRMRTENQYQEQQEVLKRIYMKFKEEVNQHLANCQSTLEGLDAHEIEVKGMVEKQRLSHRKLLLQTEEEIDAQLNDAQKRVADIHRLAREKMLLLKKGIRECLKERLLS